MKKSRWIIICGLFFISLAVHVYITDFPKRITIYPDEWRYLGIARSLVHGELSLHNVSSDFQKVLYSLLIAPAFSLRLPSMQIRAVGWINCVLSASSVFPAWLLIQRLVSTGWKQYYIVIMAGFMPYTLLTMTFMSEVLYLPLSLWTLWAGYGVLYERILKRRIKYAILFGILCYLSYLNKEIALYYMIAYVIISGMIILQGGEGRGNTFLIFILSLGVFVICFVFAKTFIFAGMGNSYNQQDLTSVLRLDKIGYMCYAFVYNGIFAMIAFGVFPVLTSIIGLFFGGGRRKYKRYMGFVLLSWIIGIGAIVYTISVREDFPHASIRQHMRYLEPLLIPMLAGLLDYFPEKVERRSILIGTVIIVVIAGIVLHRIPGTLVDQQSLIYYVDAINILDGLLVSGNKLSEWIVKLVLLGTVVLTALILYHKKYKFFLYVFIIGFSFLNVLNFYLGYKHLKNQYIITEETQEEMDRVASNLNNLEGNILIISSQGLGIDNCLIDTYLDFQNVYITSVEYPDENPGLINGFLEMESSLADGVLELDSEKVFVELPWGYYNDLKHAEYILAESSVILSNVQKMDRYQIGDGYVLYKNINPKFIYVEQI